MQLMTNKNPNNLSAELYDLVRLPLKGSALTDAELETINFLVQPGASILDVGAGTGRHAIALAKQGFKLSAIDSASRMLAVLQQKAEEENLAIKTIYADVLSFALPDRSFDLALLMWNTFNEIALTEQDAKRLLKVIKHSLIPNGYILLNIDNADTIDPEHFDFTTTTHHASEVYTLKWSTQSFDARTNTVTSREEITLTQNDGTVSKRTQALIKQRYWRKGELERLAQESGYTVQYLHVRGTDELYLLLTNDTTS